MFFDLSSPFPLSGLFYVLSPQIFDPTPPPSLPRSDRILGALTVSRSVKQEWQAGWWNHPERGWTGCALGGVPTHNSATVIRLPATTQKTSLVFFDLSSPFPLSGLFYVLSPQIFDSTAFSAMTPPHPPPCLALLSLAMLWVGRPPPSYLNTSAVKMMAREI